MSTERVGRLREKALAPGICCQEFYLHFYRFLDENNLMITDRTYGQAFRYACEHITPVIGEEELIVGRVVSCLSEADRAAWEGRFAEIGAKQSSLAGPGQDSHMAIDYPMLLQLGISGLLKRIADYEACCTDERKRDYYACCRDCLTGVTALSDRYASLARALAESVPEPRRSELLHIADVCEKVPSHPAEHFDEAVQAVHFITHVLSFNPFRVWAAQQFQLGHPDRYLYEYYQKDKAAGLLTDDAAQELLDCLAIQINHRVPSGLSSGYMLGGHTADGATIANELTDMGLQVIDDVHLVYPSVGLCCTKDYPEALLRKSCEILSHGRSHPAIFNDEIITEGLISYGLSPEAACEYIHSTCVEITPVGRSNVWVASPYTNLPGLLLTLLDREYDSFEALVEAYKAALGERIRANFEDQNQGRAHRAAHSINPLLSCFVHDCLETGTDIERGGAVCNWIMPSFVGMANLVDSLYAIKILCFDEKSLSIPDYKEILAKNFEGHEALRMRVLETIPKYGNNLDEVDLLFDDFSRFISKECRNYTPHFQGARLIPSVFCWIMHEQFGSQTGATPDGRLACFPLGDGSGPAQGREKSGPTASILSATKWSHKEFIGGVAVNMKFSKKLFSEQSIDRVIAVIRTYLLRGGFELQINVVDRETLLDAREHPENHGDLVVRIGGYSDYFVRLSGRMQEELLERTEHEI
ncbi:MAG: hypothetical protein MJ175_01030 [Clostridia bacterium]|nr:hypothetical protein [Clostridia bacterium]